MTVTFEGNAKYRHLAHKVEKQIRVGKFSPGQPVPSIRALMASDKLSKGTVIKSLELLEQRGLVTRHPQRGYFVASTRPVKPKVAQIAFLTAALNGDLDPYVKGMTEAIAGREEFSIATYSSFADLDRFQDLVRRAPEAEPAGFVLIALSPKVYSLDLTPLARSGIPAVIIGEPMPGLNCDRVIQTGHDAGQRLVRHLIDRGRTDFALLLDSGIDEGYRELARALRAGLAGAGQSLPEDRIFIYDSPHGWQNPPDPYIDAQRTTEDLVRRGLNFKTLVCRSDYSAVGALRALLAAGVRVPGDVAVASSVRCAAESVSPKKLTTVDTHREEQGRIAVQLLLHRIDGHEGPPEVHHVAGELVVGETT